DSRVERSRPACLTFALWHGRQFFSSTGWMVSRKSKAPSCAHTDAAQKRNAVVARRGIRSPFYMSSVVPGTSPFSGLDASVGYPGKVPLIDVHSHYWEYPEHFSDDFKAQAKRARGDVDVDLTVRWNEYAERARTCDRTVVFGG